MGTPPQRSSPKNEKKTPKKKKFPQPARKNRPTHTHAQFTTTASVTHCTLKQAHAKNALFRSLFFLFFFLGSGDQHEVIMGQQTATRQGFQPPLHTPLKSNKNRTPPCICGGVRFLYTCDMRSPPTTKATATTQTTIKVTTRQLQRRRVAKCKEEETSR